MESLSDKLRPPSINQSIKELEQMQARIDKGDLPPDYIERHFDAVDANVFGFDAPKDKNGQRQEQGLGSPRNQTRQSIEAYKRWHKDDKDFQKTLETMEAQLAANQQKNPTDIREIWRRRQGKA